MKNICIFAGKKYNGRKRKWRCKIGIKCFDGNHFKVGRRIKFSCWELRLHLNGMGLLRSGLAGIQEEILQSLFNMMLMEMELQI